MARLDFKLVFLFRDKDLSAASRDYFNAHARACANEEKDKKIQIRDHYPVIESPFLNAAKYAETTRAS